MSLFLIYDIFETFCNLIIFLSLKLPIYFLNLNILKLNKTIRIITCYTDTYLIQNNLILLKQDPKYNYVLTLQTTKKHIQILVTKRSLIFKNIKKNHVYIMKHVHNTRHTLQDYTHSSKIKTCKHICNV